MFLVKKENSEDDETSGVAKPDEENVVAGVVGVDALLVEFKAFEVVMQVM